VGLIDLLKEIEKGRKSGPFIWINKAAKSFKTLKKAFIIMPVLVYFDFSKKIRIKTNILKFVITSTIS
jgi:hypothetical protein